MATGASRLAANMQALSYAMGLASTDEQALQNVPLPDAPGFNVTVRGGQAKPGPVRAHAQDASIAPASSFALELEPGKPFKNFGRAIAYGMGIALPYNLRQAADQQEQNEIDDQNAQALAQSQFDTFYKNLDAQIAAARNDGEKMLFESYRNRGTDAQAAYFAPGASDAHRAAAIGLLTAAQTDANEYLEHTAETQIAEASRYMIQETTNSRVGLQTANMARNDLTFGTETDLARIENTPMGSVEEQMTLRQAAGNAAARAQSSAAAVLKGLGGAAGAFSANPYVAAASVAAGALGAFVEKKDQMLDRETVIKMIIEAHDATVALDEAFTPQLIARHDELVKAGKPYGIPQESWQRTPFTLPTPRTNAYREKYFPQGGSRTVDTTPPPERETVVTGLAEKAAEVAKDVAPKVDEAVRNTVEFLTDPFGLSRGRRATRPGGPPP